MSQVNGLYLKELDEIIQNWEQNDRNDVAEAIPHLKDNIRRKEHVVLADLTLLEGKANSDEPFHCNGNHAIDAS